MLYGVDWHVITRVKDYKKFMSGFTDLMLGNNFMNQAELNDFMGGNAKQFLGLEPGNKNYERLKTFYKNHNISYPSWF